MQNPVSNPLRVLVFGGTGPTGRHVLAHALRAGHQVTAFVRRPEAVEAAPGLTVVQGDALDPDAVARVVPGHDAVIVALGAPPRSRAELRTRAHRILVDAMEAAGVRRLVSLSSHGVAESVHELPPFLRWVVVPLYLRRAFDDHEGQEAVVRNSGLDWTLVRPPSLTDGPAAGAVAVSPTGAQPASMKIPRVDVAEFLVASVREDRWIRETPVVAAA